MSDENVEQMRRFIAAFNTRDVDAWLADFDPNGEFHSAFGAVGGEVYHGHDGLRRYESDMEDAWGNKLRIEPSPTSTWVSSRSRPTRCTGAVSTAGWR